MQDGERAFVLADNDDAPGNVLVHVQGRPVNQWVSK